MVSTSNCPPLVAMSVVTRWRRTFSSSVTHFTVMSGFLAVNSLVNACILIMSPLFTVAMVRVVCAIDGAAPNKVAAPRRAPRTCFTVTSLMALSICPRLAIMFTPGPGIVKDWNRASERTRKGGLGSTGPHTRIGWRKPARDKTERPVSSLRFEDRARRRLVGDQPVEEPPLQRRPDGRNLGTTDRCSDGQGLGRYLRWNAGEAKVCPAFDEAPLLVECPADQFANGAQPHHLKQLFARDETVNMDLRLPIHLPDPDKPQVGLGGDRSHPGDRIYLEHLVALALGRHQKWQRHRIMARLGPVGEPTNGVEEAGRAVGRNVSDQ